MAWGRRKAGPKITKKLAYSSVFFSSQRSSLPSLSTVSSAPEDPINAFLLHQKTAAQPPCKSKSSPVAEQPPYRRSLPLQIFFSFFHPALPPTTVSATTSATILTSAAPRLDKTCLYLGTPVSGSAASPLLLTELLHTD